MTIGVRRAGAFHEVEIRGEWCPLPTVCTLTAEMVADSERLERLVERCTPFALPLALTELTFATADCLRRLDLMSAVERVLRALAEAGISAAVPCEGGLPDAEFDPPLEVIVFRAPDFRRADEIVARIQGETGTGLEPVSASDFGVDNEAHWVGPHYVWSAERSELEIRERE